VSRYTYNPGATRVTDAKAAAGFSPNIETVLQFGAAFLIALGAALVVAKIHLGYSLAGGGVMLIPVVLWIKHRLRNLPPAAVGTTSALDRLLPASLVARYRPNLNSAELFELIAATSEGRFMIVRFELAKSEVGSALGSGPVDHDALFAEAERLSTSLGLASLNPATILCAWFHLNPTAAGLLTPAKLTLADFDEGVHWVARLNSYLTSKKPIYGGIARDWAAGFTPLLSRFGENLSQQIEFAGRHFHTQERTTQLDALVTGLDSATGSVVLIGEPGIGKTALLFGLADRLLAGIEAGSLKHHQIIALNASMILSNVEGQGDLERTVLALFTEAVHATNIVLALDEAQLFFGQGTGAVNLSQILLPILQSRSLKLVLAVTPGEWQRLRSTNSAMSSLLTPLVLSEPGQAETLRVTADRALLLEQGKLITTWPAITEAYRLSGRYFQDEAYPGKALKVLEAALNYPDNMFVTAQSVQMAIENQFGVKVSQATTSESSQLLHLEDQIHQRMINQSRAVSVVSNALRRARAGVANPRRPIGSFLFLGPTGVGKTELAKSIAALYFGNEANLIRLDMSEYQQTADIDRILESGSISTTALLPRIRQAPFSVVLFDEIEKAHPNILNLFLQLLDEGALTDSSGKPASFKDAIVIATSNAGADDIRKRIEAGEELEAFEQEFTNQLISSGAFKPELLNRFDEIVLFRPLNQAELGQVVKLMMGEVNANLEHQQIKVGLTDDAVAKLVTAGYDPRLGARPMRRMVTRRVEDAVAKLILSGEAKPGSQILLDAAGLGAESATPQPAAAPTSDPALPPEPVSVANPPF